MSPARLLHRTLIVEPIRRISTAENNDGRAAKMQSYLYNLELFCIESIRIGHISCMNMCSQLMHINDIFAAIHRNVTYVYGVCVRIAIKIVYIKENI
jgi:hypothetical protein